jgi:hypothetical protein
MWFLAAKGMSGRLLAASWPFDGVSGRAAADSVLGTLLFYRMAQVGSLINDQGGDVKLLV